MKVDQRINSIRKIRHGFPKPIKIHIDYPLWSAIRKMLPDSTKEYPLPKTVGKLDGASIKLVDGDKIRDKYFPDFSYGGHDLIYGRGNTEYRNVSFIPSGEIWLDGHVDIPALRYTLYHEVIERRLMSKGMSYDRAHKQANKAEHDAHRLGGL